MTAYGSGHVDFVVIHPRIIDCFSDYCDRWKRNSLLEIEDAVYRWQRDPDERGRGVAKNNQVDDFLRALANSIIKPPISTMYNERAWDWNYRDVARAVTRIVSHGWKATAQPLTGVIIVRQTLMISSEFELIVPEAW